MGGGRLGDACLYPLCGQDRGEARLLGGGGGGGGNGGGGASGGGDGDGGNELRLLLLPCASLRNSPQATTDWLKTLLNVT